MGNSSNIIEYNEKQLIEKHINFIGDPITNCYKIINLPIYQDNPIFKFNDVKLLKIFEKDELYKKQLITISQLYNMELNESTELILFEILINHNFYSMFYSNLLFFNFLSNVR